MSERRMKAADVSDVEFLRAVAEVQRARGSWATWGYPGFELPHLLQHFPGVPQKVLLAKARRILGRGLLTGCACGCRGGFELTDAGRAALAASEQESEGER